MAAIKSFKLVNDTWQYALFIRIGGTRDQAEGWFEKRFCCKPQPANGCYATTFFLNCERSHLIWFADRPDAGICAHEAFHSAIHVLRHAGLPPPINENDEAYAYLIQWTVNEISRKS